MSQGLSAFITGLFLGVAIMATIIAIIIVHDMLKRIKKVAPKK